MNMLGAGCALAAIMLAACGSDNPPSTDPGSARASDEAKVAPTGSASAEEVALEMRRDVQCPPKSVKPAGGPVSDVVGVRPGMTWDEAANAVMCDNPLLVVTENTARGYEINTYGAHIRQGFDATFAEPRVEKTPKQIMEEMQDAAMRRGMNAYEAPLQPGQSRYFVSTMGLPGKERVISVSREEYYADGKLPAVEALKQALIKKYGQPTQIQDQGQQAGLWWEYDPTGRQVTETSPLYRRCRFHVSPDAATSLSPDCGITVGALIRGAKSNPGLAHSLAVTSQDGAGGYQLVNSTQQALLQQNQARQAKELSQASKSADAPKL